MFTRAKRNKLVFYSIVILLFLAAYSHYQQMASWEVVLFKYIYNLPSYLGDIMSITTLLGSVWMVVIVCIFSLAFQKLRLAANVIFVSIVTFGLTEIIKGIVARPRPFELLQDVSLRTDYIGSMGFPSGHTAVATVVALTISPYIPKKLYWLVPSVIVLVGISRLYLGVHAPLDILGGFVLGFIVYHTFVLIKPQFKKAINIYF